MAAAAWRRLARAESRLCADLGEVAGVDEAGRGPLAGPVVAAAVILPRGERWKGLDDSKKMVPELRTEMFARVREKARAFAFSVVGPRAIERSNIRVASLTAMRRSVSRLKLRPEMVLVDGDDLIPELRLPQQAVVDGDAKMLSIAAASVVAKVVRDRIMERFDALWPQYGFARHKGYSTPEHLEALAKLGPCPLHRFTYSPVCVLELPFETELTTN